MPLYGRGFILSDENKHGLYEPAYQAIPAGPYTSVAGIWGYNEVPFLHPLQLMHASTYF